MNSTHQRSSPRPRTPTTSSVKFPEETVLRWEDSDGSIHQSQRIYCKTSGGFRGPAVYCLHCDSHRVPGIIQVTNSDGSISYVGAVGTDGSYDIVTSISDAIAVSLPSAGPSAPFGTSNADGGYIGVSINAAQVLSNGVAATKRKSSIRREGLRKRTLTADQLATVVAINGAETAAYLTLVNAAALAFSIAATAAWNAAFSITGLPLAAPALAAEQIYATATALVAYKACVAFRAAQQTAFTAADAAANPDNPTSVAADAAALAISVAANAAAGNDVACNGVAQPFSIAYTASEAQAAAASANANAEAMILQAIAAAAYQAWLNTPSVVAITPTVPVPTEGSAYALVIPSLEDDISSNIWSLNCVSGGLTAAYPNANGDTLSTTTFFSLDGNLALTGNLATFDSFHNASSTAVTLNILSSSLA